MRSGRQKFEAHALPFVSGVAEKNDAAFLLFLGKWISEYDHSVHVERLVEVKQPAMRVNDDRFAALSEAPAVGILSGSDHPHPHKNAGTPANLVDFDCLWHGKSMLRQFHFEVNEAVPAVFLQRNLLHYLVNGVLQTVIALEEICPVHPERCGVDRPQQNQCIHLPKCGGNAL